MGSLPVHSVPSRRRLWRDGGRTLSALPDRAELLEILRLRLLVCPIELSDGQRLPAETAARLVLADAAHYLQLSAEAGPPLCPARWLELLAQLDRLKRALDGRESGALPLGSAESNPHPRDPTRLSW